jgi:hypothetical protein
MFINNPVKTSDYLSRTIACMGIYFETSLIAGKPVSSRPIKGALLLHKEGIQSD